MMSHAKYRGSMPCGFGQEGFKFLETRVQPGIKFLEKF